MAQEVPITGGPEQAKIRSPWAPALLPYVTLGIYSLVWWYKINREMADLGRKRGTTELGEKPVNSLLALFPGGLIIVPAIWTIVTTYQRSKKAQQMIGVSESNQLNGWIYAIALLVISPVAYAYLQDGLNKVWRIDSGIEPAGGLPPATWSPEDVPQQQMSQGQPVAPPAPPESPVPGVIPEQPSVQPPPPAPEAGPPPPPAGNV